MRPVRSSPAAQRPTPLKAPTPAEITQVTEILENRWSRNAILAMDRYEQAIWRNDHNAASRWAIACGVNTDKVLILKGRPTEIVGHLHAHRHDMGQVMDKLMLAAKHGRASTSEPAEILPVTLASSASEK